MTYPRQEPVCNSEPSVSIIKVSVGNNKCKLWGFNRLSSTTHFYESLTLGIPHLASSSLMLQTKPVKYHRLILHSLLLYFYLQIIRDAIGDTALFYRGRSPFFWKTCLAWHKDNLEFSYFSWDGALGIDQVKQKVTESSVCTFTSPSWLPPWAPIFLENIICRQMDSTYLEKCNPVGKTLPSWFARLAFFLFSLQT